MLQHPRRLPTLLTRTRALYAAAGTRRKGMNPASSKRRSRFVIQSRKQEQDAAKRASSQASYSADDDYLASTFAAGNDDERRGAKTELDGGERLSKKAKLQHAEETLQRGLQTPLSQDNLGFKLLRMLGHKDGRGVGKTEGIKEPIAIVRRATRMGLGVHERRQEIEERKKELIQLRQHHLEQAKHNFKQTMSSKFTDKRLADNLCRAMKLVENLDRREGKPRTFMWWSDSPEEEGQVGGGAQSGRVMTGSGLDSDDERPLHPPQPQQAAAPLEDPDPAESAEDVEGFDDDDVVLWKAMTTNEKLSLVVAHLREAYTYCLYCGHQYQCAEELEKECPGLAEDDH